MLIAPRSAKITQPAQPMSVESAADRAVFTNPEEFGTAAIYTVAGGDPTPIDGIFDNDYQLLADFNDGPGISGSSPVFAVTQVMPIDSAAGDTILIDTVNYSVAELMPDQDGLTILRLQKA